MLTPTPTPNWNEVLPSIFSDPRFRQTSRNRWRIDLDGTRAGIVVAWRTWRFENHALNQNDMNRLRDFMRDGKLDAAFVVAARIAPRASTAQVYVSYRDAQELHDMLKSILPLDAGFGPFWLLRQHLVPLGFGDEF
jgi:hypothetical protein